jgi:integrase
VNGTVTKRARKTGKPSWGYVFDIGRDESGKRLQSTKSGFRTKTEADAALRIAVAAHEASVEDANNPPPPALPTFAEFFARWMDEHAARRCSPKTLEAYGQHGAYAVREFGKKLLTELTPELLEGAMNKLQDQGSRAGKPLSAKTISHIFFVVNAALRKAIKWRLIDHNPMEAVDRPVKRPKATPIALDNAEMKTLLNRAANTRLYPLLVLAAATGCRRGELLALEWSDLDFRTGAVTISKSLEETRTGLRVKAPKSNKPRMFSIPASALTVLEEHKVIQDRDRAMFGADYEEHNLVFCRPDGAYYCPDQMSVRVTSFARKIGMPGVGLHSLRHSHASQLISSGAPITAVSDRLGHANSAITLSIYSHALPADVNAAAEVWNAAMANVIQAERKATPTRMLANVSGNNIKNTDVVENNEWGVVGAAGLEPATLSFEG